MTYIEAMNKAAKVADAFLGMGIICGTYCDSEEKAFIVCTNDETLKVIEYND